MNIIRSKLFPDVDVYLMMESADTSIQTPISVQLGSIPVINKAIVNYLHHFFIFIKPFTEPSCPVHEAIVMKRPLSSVQCSVR